MNQLIEFAVQNNIQVDQLYIDRFWHSLYQDKWIYLDTEIVKWIGYDDDRIKTGKNYVLKKLKENFVEGEHFKLIKLEDADECDMIPSIDFDTIHNKHLLIVELDTFKLLLLSMNTAKARQVQKYFIQVEKLCRKFMQAQINSAMPNIQRMKLEPNEVVYVISNNKHSREHLYKIGRTKNLKGRLSSLNTSNPDRSDDRLRAFVVINCFDSKSLEAMIHTHLDAYRHSDSKEWFQIDYDQLLKVVDHFRTISNSTIDLINSLDKTDESAQIESEPEVCKPKALECGPKENTCPNCAKTYKFASKLFLAHVKFCKK